MPTSPQKTVRKKVKNGKKLVNCQLSTVNQQIMDRRYRQITDNLCTCLEEEGNSFHLQLKLLKIWLEIHRHL